MKWLVKFSLCYDCTDSILRILVRNCRKTLRILDVEMSKQVTDESAERIAQCENIHTLHIFHTDITEVGHSLILRRLTKLKVLVRGDLIVDSSRPLRSKGKFEQNERVLCYEPDPQKVKVIYEAKIIGIDIGADDKGKRRNEYLVHFNDSHREKCLENQQTSLQIQYLAPASLNFGRVMQFPSQNKSSQG